MGCILRVDGVSFEPAQFLKGSALVVDKVWHRGDERLAVREDAAVHASSGFNVVVSSGALDNFDEQVADLDRFVACTNW
jgi:hypothetical protein